MVLRTDVGGTFCIEVNSGVANFGDDGLMIQWLGLKIIEKDLNQWQALLLAAGIFGEPQICYIREPEIHCNSNEHSA